MGGKGGGGAKIPKPPGIKKSYAQGAQVYLQYLPQFVQAEDQYRNQEDPNRIASQQALQQQYGPTQYAQQTQALQQLDPGWLSAHNALGNAVTNDVAAGSSLTPQQSTEFQQDYRGAQAARGNIYGDAAGIAEAYGVGNQGLALYNQRLQNANSFVNGQTVPQTLANVAPVSPDRSFAYADPNAGWQGVNAANARYQGMVGAAAANSGGGGGGSSTNTWISTIGSIAAAVAAAY